MQRERLQPVIEHVVSNPWGEVWGSAVFVVVVFKAPPGDSANQSDQVWEREFPKVRSPLPVIET